MAEESAGVPAPRFDETRVKLLLGGDEQQVGEGLACIEGHLRRRLIAWLSRRFPGLSPDDVEDVWADTLVCVLQTVRKGTYRPERPLLPWLRRIVRSRAIDSVRREAAHERTLATVRRVLDLRIHSEEVTQDEAPASEVAARVRATILTLPPRQRTVLQVFVEHYPESAQMAVLREEVSRVTGAEITLAAVKRALQEGRRKLCEALVGQRYFPQAG